jgi:hypothetical protein
MSFLHPASANASAMKAHFRSIRYAYRAPRTPVNRTPKNGDTYLFREN